MVRGVWAFEWSELERHLLKLALNEGAAEGESANAAHALIRALRKRQVSAEEIFSQSAPTQTAQLDEVNLRRLAGMRILNFGKFRGRMLSQVPESYLRWLLNEGQNLTPGLRNDLRTLLNL